MAKMQVKRNAFRELFKFIGKVNGYEARSVCYRNLIDAFDSRLSLKESKFKLNTQMSFFHVQYLKYYISRG